VDLVECIAVARFLSVVMYICFHDQLNSRKMSLDSRFMLVKP